MIKQIYFKILYWLSLFFPATSIYKYEACEGLPKALQKYKVYVLGGTQNPWMAAMLCPCGCNDILHMNLLTSNRPNWKVTISTNSSVSFHPSLWRKSACKSHFFLKNGKVNWV